MAKVIHVVAYNEQLWRREYLKQPWLFPKCHHSNMVIPLRLLVVNRLKKKRTQCNVMWSISIIFMYNVLIISTVYRVCKGTMENMSQSNCLSLLHIHTDGSETTNSTELCHRGVCYTMVDLRSITKGKNNSVINLIWATLAFSIASIIWRC